MRHGHLERRRHRDAAAGVLDHPPGFVVEMRAVDEQVALAQDTGFGEREPRRGIDPIVHDRGHSRFARRGQHLRVKARAERERQQLVLRAEIGLLQARDVLRPLHRRPGAARVAVDRADAGVLQRLDAGVAVLGRMADLGEINDRGRAHVDEAERGDQHAGIDIVGRVGGRPLVLDVAVVIGIDQAVRQRAPQQALVGMTVGVDKAGNQDSVRRIDNHGRVGGDVDVGPHLADFSVLDQHVPGDKVADLRIERKNDATLQDNPSRLLQPHELGVCLSPHRSRRQRRHRGGSCQGCTRRQNGAARGPVFRMASSYVISGNSRSSRPKPSRGSRTVSRFRISQAGAILACTTGTCRSCSSSSTMLSVCQAPPWI